MGNSEMVAVETVAGRIPVIAGTGSNSTAEAIEYTRHAEEAKADAALVVVPYYNKPTQDGLYAHFRAVAEAVSLPIFVYNVPSRTVTNISIETLARLARDCPNIIGTKDASCDLARPSRQRQLSGPDFIQLSGEDGTALAFNAMGGVGCISVTANVAPRLCADFQKAMREGRWVEALQLQDRLYPLHTALFSDASPAPTKYALSRVRPGFPTALRLPLVDASEASRRTVDKALEHAGLL